MAVHSEESVALARPVVAGRREALERTFDIAGPEVMTCREMILRGGDLRGRRPLIVEMPVLTLRLSSLWLHLVTPVQAGVARELFDGLRTEIIARENDIATLDPFAPTPFDDAARTALPARDAA